MTTYVCLIEQIDDGVQAQVTEHDRGAGELHVRHGHGDSTAQALTQALGMHEAVFASDEDEIESCVAALRQRPLRISVEGRKIRALGFA